jgi:hypothetical protein
MDNEVDSRTWFEGDEGSVIDASFKDYPIISTPNDFNKSNM